MNSEQLRVEFLAKVWEKVNNFNGLVLDVITDLAVVYDIDTETAAKIVMLDPDLKKLLETQSIKLNLVRKRGRQT